MKTRAQYRLALCATLEIKKIIDKIASGIGSHYFSPKSGSSSLLTPLSVPQDCKNRSCNLIVESQC